MSVQMLQSFSGMMNGIGRAATPGMQQGMMRAIPGMTPAMASGATVAGVQLTGTNSEAIEFSGLLSLTRFASFPTLRRRSSRRLPLAEACC
jgi:hypothetical protein